MTLSFADELTAWEEAGLRRTLEQLEGIDFCTNDYLGLARDPAVVNAAVEAAQAYGTGSRAARLLGGHLPVHADLENEAAQWAGTEAALLFPSGYQANVGVLSAVARAGDVILSDAQNHASLIDGARLSRARVEVFRHNNLGDLERILRAAAGAGRRWIVVESVYSIDGSQAPLDELAKLSAAHDARLIVDEAHGVGLYGPQGQGRVAEMDDPTRVAARILTGGKALGASGALVCGSGELVELLTHKARSFVFTTAPPPPVAAALHAAIRRVREYPALRARALEAATLLRARLAVTGAGPIVFVSMGEPDAALAAARRLHDAGFYVRAVRPPTVQPGHSGLRIVCHADHSDTDIEALADALGEPHPRVVASAPTRPRAVVVVGTDTDVGKSVASAVLVRALQRRDSAVRYWKPIQTGTVSDTDAVTQLISAATLPPVVALDLPASVDQAAEAAGTRVEAADVKQRIVDGLKEQAGETFVLETAGGLLVPLNEHEDQADLLAGLDLPAVVVARSGLGTLNHTRLTLEAMRRRRLLALALILVGPRHEANVVTLRRRHPELPLFELPALEPLTAASIDAWLDVNPIEDVLP